MTDSKAANTDRSRGSKTNLDTDSESYPESHNSKTENSSVHNISQNTDPDGDQGPDENRQENHSDKRVQELLARTTDLESQVSEKEKKYAYLYAEFDNFKKRASKERSDLLKFGCESFARDVLSSIDNLERALSHTLPETDKNLVQGLNMVLLELKNTLKRYGVEEINTLKQEFDPNLHEAVGQEASDQPSGAILKEMTRGYNLHGRLLRPSKVIVSGAASH